MNKKTLASLAVVVGGVIVAGYAMSMGRDLPVIGDARNGFSGV